MEDIETTGATELHGPVSATPEPLTPAVTPEGPEGRGSSAPSEGEGAALITYGDPSQNELRILERGRGQVVLELLTGGFYATPQEDGTVAIEIPGFEDFGEPGSPQVPTRRMWSIYHLLGDPALTLR